MKAVVFDNSGTLVHRYRIIKDLSSGEFITNINSLDLIDKMETAALVVLQFNIDCLKKINQDMRVWDLIVDYDIGYDVSYSSMPVSDDEVDEILRNDDTIRRPSYFNGRGTKNGIVHRFRSYFECC